MDIHSSPLITRYPDVIFSRHDVPYASALTFNAGIIRQEGRYMHFDGIRMARADVRDVIAACLKNPR